MAGFSALHAFLFAAPANKLAQLAAMPIADAALYLANPTPREAELAAQLAAAHARTASCETAWAELATANRDLRLQLKRLRAALDVLRGVAR